jgi:hypothetical protein
LNVSLDAVKAVLARAIQDEEFRNQLKADPATVLASYDLTDDEQKALAATDINVDVVEALEDRESKSMGPVFIIIYTVK